MDYYARRIRYSHVIYLTSLLETSLDRACSKLTTAVGEENIPFRLRDLAGDQWSKKRKFLERYGRFQLPSDLWSKLKTLIEVRNYLVHENGSTAEVPAEQRRKLQRYPGLDVEGHEFKIEDAYVRDAFDTVRSFVSVVEKQVGEVIKRAKHPLRAT